MVGLLLALVAPIWNVGPEAGQAALTQLTPRQLAGQRVIYSYHGLTPPNSLLQRIRHGEAAGVIFFGENISSRQQIASVIDKLRAASRQSPVQSPLLLLTDQEGGQINRLPGGPSRSEKDVGQAADPAAAATKTGRTAARSLSGVGMNLNLAPVLGVYRRPGDFLDQYGRSYGTDPKQDGALGAAYIKASQQGGVATTAKHFPGLGAAGAKESTDLRPVTLNVSLNELRSVDERPYADAVKAGTKVVMASWAVYPALDPDRPAGLSSKIIQGELRDRLGFRGVTMTDALEAKALRDFGSPAHRGVLAAQAGMDLLLCSARDENQGDSAAGGLTTALRNGTLDGGTFRAAVGRVTRLRDSLR
jgi:beta-N-acetylhexosaminidase